MRDIRERLIISGSACMAVILAGTLSYYFIGDGRWTLLECLYQTFNTVTTLGAKSLPGLDETAGARTLTIALLVSGIGTFLYFASTLTATLVEGELHEVVRRKRMQKQIDNMSGHVIVCGAGETGRYVVGELLESGVPLVAIDIEESQIRQLQEKEGGEPFPYIVGDAADDDVLAQAGIARARAVVAALREDKDNLYVVLTARSVNPGLRIVARGTGRRAPEKLRKAGADSVVSMNYIGGMRLANEVIRPHVTEFIEEMLREKNLDLRLEEVTIPADSPLSGLKLRDAHIRTKTDALVLAIRDREDGQYEYSPGPDVVLRTGSTLVVMVPLASLPSLRRGLETGFTAS